MHSQYNYQRPIHRHHWKYLLVLLIFLGVLWILYITSGDNSLTGNSILDTAAEKLKGDTISFSAELTKPSYISLDGNLGSIQLRGDSLASFNAGKQRFSLENLTDNHLFLSDYNGQLEFDSDKLRLLDGKVSRASVNGFSISSTSGGNTDVSLDDAFDYRYMKINGNAYIEYLEYNTTGTVTVNDGRNIFNLNGENLLIQDFEGSIETDMENFRLYGEVALVEIRGDGSILIKA